VWLKQNDLVFHSNDDIKAAIGTKLAPALNQPSYFGYLLRISPEQPENSELLANASPAALGTLMYIAYETRRIWETMNPRDETFQPLEVSSLVETEDYAKQANQSEGMSHTSGQVFDIAYANLPAAEQECLRFILDDLGWDGYLGFVDEGSKTIHIGCAPNAREFFAAVFQEGAERFSAPVAANPVVGQE
jgi:hypothetical protein